MSVSVTINLIFALLNLLVILYIAWYFLIRYFIPSLRTGLRDQKQRILNQQHTYDKALVDYEAIKQQRGMYDVQAEQLLRTIKRWHEDIEQKKYEEKRQLLARTHAIESYMQDQYNSRQIAMMQEYVLNQSYSDALQRLQKKYSVQKEGKKALQAMVHTLTRDVHG